MDSIESRIRIINEKISISVQKSGRTMDDVKLIGVTKTIDVPYIRKAVKCGITDLGENRVQELTEKYSHISNVNWHLIGHLQKNKVKYIIDKVKLIHSIDTFELATEIDRQAKKRNKVQEILIQVNVSGEETKFGVAPESVLELCKRIGEFENVQVKGLMTIAPFSNDEEMLRNVFRRLRQISLDISYKNIDNITMDEISMGMTNDYEMAIEEGATLVRVGTGIFGKRDYN